MIRPILFNTQMVQAILDKRKTVTRRFVSKEIVDRLAIACDWMIIAYIDQATGDFIEPLKLCKYQKGDILWVRETWQYAFRLDDSDMPIEGTERYYYAAGPDDCIPSFTHWLDPNTGDHKDRMPWKPSIHMPKQAARIFLKVTNVRIKRLHSMAINDFLNEGIEIRETSFNDPENAFMKARNQFIELWDSTLPPNKDKFKSSVGAWSNNPWVWVIEFEPCEKPEGWPC